MKVQFPVTIMFDAIGRIAGQQTARTFTMRLDLDDADASAEYCLSHPPATNAAWIVDRDNVLAGLFRHDTEKLIKARALAYPEGYGVANDNDSLDDVDRAVVVVTREIEAVE